ncbi:hypothetical protein CU048_01865 [Beijerinckiaceae bacterium]|nr:hypothetical protein CU048_01865 [Beijerinckiaceae bacterium]
MGAALFFAALGLSLASCGRRGPLEPPPGVPVSSSPLNGTIGDNETPRELPSQKRSASPDDASETVVVPVPAHRAPKPFLLDPLL